MKKLLCISAALLLCVSLAACGKKPAATQTPDEPQSWTPDEPQATTTVPPVEISGNSQMLLTDTEPLADMEAVKREHYDNGSYYYMDVAGEDALRCINSCYQTTLREGETEEEYAQLRAIGMSMTMSPGNPYNLMVGKSDELSEALGAPVYLVTFLTGSDLNATCWTVYLTRTEHYSYQYAFAASSQTSMTLEEQMMEYFGTFKLAPMTAQ